MKIEETVNYQLINDGDNNGQRWHCNYYCPTCHVCGRIPHVKGCTDKKVRISATARIPRKDASDSVWRKFYEKFVLRKDLREFLKKKQRRTPGVKEYETYKIKSRKTKSWDMDNH